MRKRHGILPIIMIISIFTGCLGTERAYPDKRSFMLDVTRQGAPSTPIIQGTLMIQRFRVSSQYEGKQFVYRQSASSYETDPYNEFFVLPATLLTDEVQEWLDMSGIFQNVVNSSSPVEANYTLESELTALYGDYSEKEAPRAVLRVKFLLVRQVSDRSEVSFQKHYQEMVPLKGSAPEDLVNSWNEGLRRILEALEKDMREKLMVS